MVIDRDRLPSDQVLSTHTIHPPGIDVLDELGAGGRAGRSGRVHGLRCDGAIPVSTVIAALVGALLRGRLGVIPEFMVQARRTAEYRRAFEQRQRLLDEASAGLGDALE
jgi:hypothetical protein